MRYSEVYRSLVHLHEKQPTCLVARKIEELEELKLAYHIPKDEHEFNLASVGEYRTLMEEERRLARRSGSLDFERDRIVQPTLWHWIWTKGEVFEKEQEEAQRLLEEKEKLSRGIHNSCQKIIEIVKRFDKYEPGLNIYVDVIGAHFSDGETYLWFDRDPETRLYARAVHPYNPISRFDPGKFVARFFRLGKKKGYVAPSGLGTYLFNGFGEKEMSCDLKFSWNHFYKPAIEIAKDEERFREWCLSGEAEEMLLRCPGDKEAFQEWLDYGYSRNH